MQPFGRTSLKECIRLRDRSLALGDEVKRHLAKRVEVIERAKNPDNDAAATETA